VEKRKKRCGLVGEDPTAASTLKDPSRKKEKSASAEVEQPKKSKRGKPAGRKSDYIKSRGKEKGQQRKGGARSREAKTM